jgi:broad specificity phosphatase PhoE
VYTSTYRRAVDTAAVAFPGLGDGWPRQTALLDEQHYGDATYMTKDELFATYPDGAEDRNMRKHLWVPPGGGESLAGGVWQRSLRFVAIARSELRADDPVIAVTHHTTILALRAILERRSLIDLVEEARSAKTPTAGILRYELAAGEFGKPETLAPPTD